MRLSPAPLAALALLLSWPAAAAQPAVLLKDINTKAKPNPSSYPMGYAHNFITPWNNFKFPKIGTVFFFRATDASHGSELWKFDPSAGKAVLLKDIQPGSAGSGPSTFTPLGNKILFSAFDSAHGREPWITDGTPAGTILLKDCNPGASSGGCYFPVVMGGKAYWTSSNGTTYDIWCTDGTPAGTRKVFSGLTFYWYYPVVLGRKIVFRGSTKTNGYEPWVTDGTAGGTRMLLDVRPGSSSGYFYDPVVLGGICYFFSYLGNLNYGLYKTDGTPSGTKPVLGGFNSSWYMAIPFGGKIIFRGKTSASGYEPWITDGTAPGTKILKDIEPGPGSGYFSYPVIFNKKLYFEARAPKSMNSALWETDGTPGGTQVLSLKTRYFNQPTVLGSYIYFRGYGTTAPHGFELWKTDGTDKGTMEVKDIHPGPSSSYPSYMTQTAGNKFIFTANDGVHGAELWISDGTEKGTRLLQDIYPVSGTNDSYPHDFIGVSGITYFTADDGLHGRELWKTDGTRAGTVLVKDINPGPGAGVTLDHSRMFYWRHRGAWKPVALGKTLFFQGFTTSAGWEIWKTDGTSRGTALVKDIYPGSAYGFFYYGCVLGNQVYFFARDPSGYALFKTDGTSKGTVKVKGGFKYFWYYPFPYRGKILFLGSTAQSGMEPWITDGTAAGTKMLKDIRPGPGTGGFSLPVAMGGKVYFRANTQTGYNGALWVTDGTPEGTKEVFASTWPGFGYNLTAMGNKLFFRGYDANHGYEPWISDGTAAGTKMLKDIRTGTSSGSFLSPCVLGSTLFFQANDGIHGYELWKTDGTPAGTSLVKDLYAGPGSSFPLGITPAGSRKIVFRAYDGGHGYELWQSDGTAAGTKLAADVYPGGASSNPYYMLLSGGRVLFRARNLKYGTEPWFWFPGATAKDFGFATSDSYNFTATDPVLGKKTRVTLSGMKWGQAAVFAIAAPTHAPAAFAGGWIYLDVSNIYTAAFLTPWGGSSLDLPVPNEPALTGAQAALQAMVFPTPRAPWSVDLTNALLLTFGP